MVKGSQGIKNHPYANQSFWLRPKAALGLFVLFMKHGTYYRHHGQEDLAMPPNNEVLMIFIACS